MNKQYLSILIAALGMSAAVAQAADQSWYLVPQVGALIPDGKLEAETGWFGGVKLGKPISDSWDLQLGATYGEASEDSAAYSSGKFKQTTASLEALYLFSRTAFRPFLSVGIGGAQDKLNYTGTPNATASRNYGMGSLGAGFQYDWTKSTFLQADLRYVVTATDLHNSNLSFSELGNLYAGIGVGFKFGEVPQPAPKPAPEPVVVAPVVEKTCEELGTCVKVEPPKVEAAPVVEVKPVEPPPPAPDKYEVVENNLRADGAFATGSGLLTQKGKNQIDAAIAAAGTSYDALSKQEGLELTVVGHADRTGKADVNQTLSEKRADAVKSYLVSKGISADAIKTAGRGSSEPVTKADDCKKLKGKKLSACLAPDRRIELHGKATRVVKQQ